jgi:serine/threonine-protein kinase RsbW
VVIVRIELMLALPRDATSVPLSRRVITAALDSLDVTDDCRYDIQLAMAEACSNAVRHADPAVSYDVSVVFDEEQCAIEVCDEGSGFDPDELQAAAPAAESGRGLRIMRMVTDRFELTRRAGGGTVVRFVMRLRRAHPTPLPAPG